jgi:uncharacterized LabA/DUF88 family protein
MKKCGNIISKNNMDTAALFVDVQNIYYTVKQQYNCHFDYSVFWNRATTGRHVEKAIAYATYKGDRKQSAFQNILKNIGFDIKLKPFIKRSDGSTKGDWDVGIAMDVMEYAKSVNTIILASGDGDFAVMVDDIKKRHGVIVEIYGVPSLTAAALIKSASRFIPIEEDLVMPIPQTW